MTWHIFRLSQQLDLNQGFTLINSDSLMVQKDELGSVDPSLALASYFGGSKWLFPRNCIGYLVYVNLSICTHEYFVYATYTVPKRSTRTLYQEKN